MERDGDNGMEATMDMRPMIVVAYYAGVQRVATRKCYPALPQQTLRTFFQRLSKASFPASDAA